MGFGDSQLSSTVHKKINKEFIKLALGTPAALWALSSLYQKQKDWPTSDTVNRGRNVFIQ